MKTITPARALSLGLLGLAATGKAVDFRGLGDLRSPQSESYGYAISGDGKYAVGRGTSSSPEAFRCGPDGMFGLGDLAGGPRESYGYGVSGNGSVVVGASASSTQGPQAFRWTAGGGMQGLGYLSNRKHSEALGVSPDGAVIAGYALLADGTPKAFSWTATTGLTPLADLASGLGGSKAAGAAAGILAGESWGQNGLEAVRWIDGQAYGLGDLPGGGFQSAATAIAANGIGIVGYGQSDRGFEGFLWSPDGDQDIRNPHEGGMIALGDLEGGAFNSSALAISNNGYIVGYGTTDRGTEAFLWNRSTGMRRLSDILTGQGADLGGWTLTSANGISQDGQTIVGTGIDPLGHRQAWMANLNVVPEPTCLVGLGLGAAALVRRRRSQIRNAKSAG